MPELPEVQTIAAGVNARVRGDRIESVWVSSKKEPFKTPAADMQSGLVGRRILEVRRVGKHIVFDLGRKEDAEANAQSMQAQWIVHLGMTGRLLVSSRLADVAVHTHTTLGLGSGRELRFIDSRRFGRLAFREFGELEGQPEGFQGPGEEPLTISTKRFLEVFRGRRTPIKAALLNQKLLQGVGNIYADEALFRAGIRPRRMAGRLTRTQLVKLQSSLATVLREAIALGGSSVSDYVDADGVKGFFQLEHRVYLRTGQPCLVCGTPIRRILIGGRGTHFCPTCQE
jgi:formamidopyrimidine-DNA glycosylase